jgi:hypothetical protein
MREVCSGNIPPDTTKVSLPSPIFSLYGLNFLGITQVFPIGPNTQNETNRDFALPQLCHASQRNRTSRRAASNVSNIGLAAQPDLGTKRTTCRSGIIIISTFEAIPCITTSRN